MNFYELGHQLCGDEIPKVLGIFDLSTAPPLLYYSYIPIFIAATLIGGYVFLHNRKSIEARWLLIVTIFFDLWVTNILVQWIASYHSLLMFVWQLTMLIEVGLYLSVLYFAYVFFFQKEPSSLIKILLGLLYVGVAAIMPTALNVASYDVLNCQGNNGLAWTFVYAAEPAIIALTLIMGIVAQFRAKGTAARPQILILTAGLSVFLSIFFLSNYYGELTKIYEFNFWGPLGMLVFIMLLGYMIVEYAAFNVKMLGAQALVIAMLLLTGAEFFFAHSSVNKILITATFVLVGIFGFILVHGVKKEIAQRERIEKLAHDLETINKQQVILIHFITHQIKGFVAKSRNIFSLILDGDFGPVPEQMKPMIEEGFRSDTKGAQTIQEILNAANIKSGKVVYTMAEFDLRALIEEISRDLKVAADAKGLTLTLELGSEPILMKGDRGQLINAFKNVIDNSIKYTPAGTVTVTLGKVGGKIVFSVRDTGIGITKDDMEHLFTEGGRGKNSQKINVESTGFGLYIVKNIIEAHKGTVRAESEGEGKGSTFTVELPAN